MNAALNLLAVAAVAAAALPARAAERACSGPANLVALEAPAIPVPAEKSRVLFSEPAARVYEGKGWRKLSVTRWNCLEDASDAMPRDVVDARTGLPAYAL